MTTCKLDNFGERSTCYSSSMLYPEKKKILLGVNILKADPICTSTKQCLKAIQEIANRLLKSCQGKYRLKLKW